MHLALLFAVCRRIVDFEPQTAVQWYWILIGIIGGILLVGILLIAFIRLGIYWQERREYARFEKERKGANWKEVK